MKRRARSSLELFCILFIKPHSALRVLADPIIVVPHEDADLAIRCVLALIGV